MAHSNLRREESVSRAERKRDKIEWQGEASPGREHDSGGARQEAKRSRREPSRPREEVCPDTSLQWLTSKCSQPVSKHG